MGLQMPKRRRGQARQIVAGLPVKIKVNRFKNFAGIFNNRSSAAGNIGFLTRTDSTNTIKALIDFGATSLTVAGIWYHLAVSVDRGGSMKLYLNGQPAGQVDISAYHTISLTNSDNVRFGRDQTSYYFNGELDDLRIYSSARSATDIQSLYNEAL